MEISITNKTDKPIEFPAGSLVGLKYAHTPYVRDILDSLNVDTSAKEVVYSEK